MKRIIITKWKHLWGTVIIGDNEFGGMSSEKSLNYGADSYFDLSSSMGKIEIYFTNPE